MPVATQELFAEARCFACLGASQSELLRLALMVRVVKGLDESIDVSVDTLLKRAKCFHCNSEATLITLIELALLDIMAEEME